ncbi:hypothetical protein SALBM135S_06455 [Streptomyces alboniger]
MPVEVTWWGHATCTVEDSGVRVLTDPLFARRLAHLRRRRGALPPPEAAVADVVLLSHLHADHLHVPSLARLAPGTRALVPRGASRSVPGLTRRLPHLRFTEVYRATGCRSVISWSGWCPHGTTGGGCPWARSSPPPSAMW